MLATIRLVGVAALASVALSASAAPANSNEGRLLVVLEFRSRLDAAKAREANVPYLTDQVRTAAFRAMPELRVISKGDLKVLLDQFNKTMEQCEGECAVETARNVGADLVIDGEVLNRSGQLVMPMELHETRLGTLLGTAQARGRTIDDLDASIGKAVEQLFERLKRPQLDRTSGNIVGKQDLAEVPALSGALKQGSAVNIDNADVLVAYNDAIKAERSAREHPDVAAKAWQKLAEQPGDNPYRDEAGRRAKQWRDYADEQKRLADQRGRDRERLQKVLPLEVVQDAIKEQFVLNYARLYKRDDLPPLLALVPGQQARDNINAALDCELDGKADRCLLIGLVHKQANDFERAVHFFERGCEASSAASCEWLSQLLADGQGTAPDKKRAQLALQRACDMGSAGGCKRLGQLLDDEPQKKLELFGKACDLRDGEGCFLAGKLEQQANSDDASAGIGHFRAACSLGNQGSCDLARAYDQKRADEKAAADRAEADRRREQKRLADEARRKQLERDRALAQQRAAQEAERDAIRSRRHWGYAAGAVGVAGGGALALFAMLGKGTNSDLQAGGLKTAADQQALLDKGKTYNTLALVSGGVALLGLGVGIPLVIFNSESKEPRTATLSPMPNGLLLTWRLP